jgi:hypothetical protein
LRLEALEDRLAPAVLTVNDATDSQPTATLSLREAIATVQAGSTAGLTATQQMQVTGTLGTNDTIQFDATVFAGPTTITLDPTRGSLVTGKNVTITGTGAANLTINANHAYRTFNFNNLITPSTVSLSGLTLANGTAQGAATPSMGGAILSNGTVMINSCTFTGNQAVSTNPANPLDTQGGAIQSSGTLTITNSTFTGNTATGPGNQMGATGGVDEGGAIYSNGTLTISGSTFTGNVAAGTVDPTTHAAGAAFGGAIYSEGMVTITGSTFTGNMSTSTADTTMNQTSGFVDGAAIDCETSSPSTTAGVLMISNSTFTNNVSTTTTSAVFGGAIYNDNVLTLSHNTFTNNQSVGGPGFVAYGGAFLLDFGTDTSQATGGSVLTDTGSVYSGNTGLEGGAGASFGTVSYSNDYFLNNSSTFGGALWGSTGAKTVTNSTFARTDTTVISANLGGAIYNVSGGLTVGNSTLFGNFALLGGGGIYGAGGGLTLRGDTIANNLTWGSGGGVFSVSNTAILMKNTLVAGNVAGDLASNQRPDDVSGFVNAASDHNLIGVGAGLIGVDFSGSTPRFVDITNVRGNQVGTVAHPIDPRLSDLRPNGGMAVGAPTAQLTMPTVALLPGSPAIAAGLRDTSSMGLYANDENGMARSVTPNIGAVEYVATATRFVFLNPPMMVTSGMAFNFTVLAEDAFGNVITSYIGTFSFTFSPANPMDTVANTTPDPTTGAPDATITPADNGDFASSMALVGTSGTMVTVTVMDIAHPSIMGSLTVTFM